MLLWNGNKKRNIDEDTAEFIDFIVTFILSLITAGVLITLGLIYIGVKIKTLFFITLVLFLYTIFKLVIKFVLKSI